MIKKISYFFLFGLLIYSKIVHAQTLAPQVALHYPTSVVVQVYEVVKSIKLPITKQVLLANFFVKQDSLLAIAIAKNKNPKTIEALRNDLQTELDGMLTNSEKTEYGFIKYQPQVEAKAKLIASVARNEFQADEKFEYNMYKLYLNKEIELSKTLAQYSHSPSLTANAASIIALYDSIRTKYEATAKGEQYLNSQLALLDQVKPLTIQEKKALRNNFTNRFRKSGNYVQSFDKAMQWEIKDTIYFKALYKTKLEQQSAEKSKLGLHELADKYALPDSIIRKIEPIIQAKTKAMVELDIRLPPTRQKDSLQMFTQGKYDAMVNSVLIRSGYYNLGNSGFVTALKYKKSLGLSDAQMDTLASKNMSLDTLRLSYGAQKYLDEFDEKAFTNSNLMAILDNKQYEKLLQAELFPQARKHAKNYWGELTKFNLTEKLDSTSVCQTLIAYDLKKIVTERMYADDPQARQRLLQANGKTKPDILKKLEAVRKVAANNESVNDSLTW